MGRVTVTTETLFDHPVKTIYEHVTNPLNWGDIPKSSYDNGSLGSDPMQSGDQFVERTTAGSSVYMSRWSIISAVPSRKWAVQTVNNIGGKTDGTPGVDGICTMTIDFCDVGEMQTLLKQEMIVELPRGVKMPDELLVVYARPHWIDISHEKLKRLLRAECT